MGAVRNGVRYGGSTVLSTVWGLYGTKCGTGAARYGVRYGGLYGTGNGTVAVRYGTCEGVVSHGTVNGTGVTRRL